jgi:uncharacterized membrane protein YeaQ/YmgE (transglycosylase-associated protein family)
MVIGKFIVWLIVGGLAGTVASRLLTLRKEGLGTWTNIGVGMVGAVVGGFLFGLFGIDLGLGDLRVSFEDLIAAFVGSLLCVIAWWLVRRNSSNKTPPGESSLPK